MTELSSPTRRGWKRFVPIAILVLVLIMAKVLHWDRFISYDTLAHQRAALEAFVAQHLVEALAIYIVLFVIGVSISLPVPLYLALAGGYLFGPWLAFGASWLSATLGAVLLFLAARTALGDFLRRRAGSWMVRFEAGFNDNAFTYVLALRLVPVLPFWVVNLVPAFFEVKLRDYALATLIGIIPSTLVITSVGAALRRAITLDPSLDPGRAAMHVFLSPPVLAAIAGLLVLSLVPVVLKARRKRHDDREQPPLQN